MSIRLLALDLDGTVLDSKWNLSEATRTRLRQAHAHGVQIVFVTGRRYHTTHPITSTFDFPHFVVTTAGAVTHSSAGERLSTHPMDSKLVAEVVSHMATFRNVTFLISDGNGREDLFCESPNLENPHVARFVEWNDRFLTRVTNLGETIPDGAIIEVVLLGYVAEMRDAVRRLDDFPLRHRLKVLRTEYLHRDLCLLDVLNADADKGQAVRRLAESLGIARESVMAIGDNHSDLDMLAYAGQPVVMGNATAELRSAGWPITATNDEDGVARAIERFILGPGDPSQTPAR
jgi:Cof subfamily protein (haloacid dehalogenase superfamily)